MGVKATFCQAQWQLLPCPAARFALGHRSPQLYCTLHPATFNSCPAPEQPFPSSGAVCPAGSRISTSPFAVESFKYRLPGALSLDRNNAVKTASGSEREEPRAWFEIPFLSGYNLCRFPFFNFFFVSFGECPLSSWPQHVFDSLEGMACMQSLWMLLNKTLLPPGGLFWFFFKVRGSEESVGVETPNLKGELSCF